MTTLKAPDRHLRTHNHRNFQKRSQAPTWSWHGLDDCLVPASRRKRRNARFFALEIRYDDSRTRHDANVHSYKLTTMYGKSLSPDYYPTRGHSQCKSADWRPWQRLTRVTAALPGPGMAAGHGLARLSTPRASWGPLEVPQTSILRPGEVFCA